MNKKYFTPSIEDIRVGYELEFHNWSMDEAGDQAANYDRWEATKLTRENAYTLLRYGIGSGVRVPYLTKEQIEEEGWIFKEKAGARETYYIEMERGFRLYLSRWDEAYHGDVGIYGFDDQGSLFHWYSGDCKDINTLRYIMKLLKIKNEKFETAVRS